MNTGTEGANIGHNGGPSLSDNWIAVSRDIRFHEIVGFLNSDGTVRDNVVVCETVAWLDLVMEANWKDRRANNKGRVVLIERGQLMGARMWLAKRWGWSEKKVRWFIDKLKREGMITITTPNYDEIAAKSKSGPAQGPAKGPARPNGVNVITICNYNVYQTAKELEGLMRGQQNGQQEGQRGASEGPHLNKETKKQVISPNGDSPSDQLPLDPKPEGPKKISAAEAARLAFDRYNELAARIGLPIATVLTDARKQKIVARIREAGGMAGFDKALANVERSAFLQGQNDSGFRADFDFICQAKSFSRLLDGGYGNGAHAMPKRQFPNVGPNGVIRGRA